MTDHPTAPVQDDDVALIEELRELKKGWVTSRSFSKFIDRVCDRIDRLSRISPTPETGLVEALNPDVRRRLESVAMTLETCGAHGIPIDFAMLAHDIRAALSNVLPDQK